MPSTTPPAPTPAPTPAPPPPERPLVVDLDGTLFRGDTTDEAVVLLLKHRPWSALKLPGWAAQGRARVKHELAERVVFDPARLPYVEGVLEAARAHRAAGLPVALATSANHTHAELVAESLGLFDAVLASDEATDLRGEAKRDAVVEWVASLGRGDDAFDYIGDAEEDLPVWRAAGRAMVVDTTPGMRTRVAGELPLHHVFHTHRAHAKAALRALRPQQWVKNLLVFLPMITSHQLTKPEMWVQAVLAFVCFSLAASSIYLLNDLFDLDSDRHHPTKRRRPFAAGDLPLSRGLLLAAVLAPLSLLIAVSALPPAFVAVLLTYFAVTTSYSIILKRKPIVDVICLAGLYSLRVFAGGVAVSIDPSPWLLAFCLFTFISLAFVKRYTELDALRQRQDPNVPTDERARGRGYLVADLEMIRVLGPMSGYLGVFIFCLYAFSAPNVAELYQHPQVLWLVAPILLYWISRVWLFAARGTLHEDPIVFALRDPHAYAVAGLIAVMLFIATG